MHKQNVAGVENAGNSAVESQKLFGYMQQLALRVSQSTVITFYGCVGQS